jgi:hypothetical protein
MRFTCTCGHVIRDRTDFLRYKAHFLADEDTHVPIQELAETMAGFIEAHGRGPEAEHAFLNHVWASYEGTTLEKAASGLDHVDRTNLRDVLYHVIFPFWQRYDRALYECEACGRLFMEGAVNEWISYLPEDPDRHVLASRFHSYPPENELEPPAHDLATTDRKAATDS